MLPRDLPAEDVVPFARAAEEAGFDELWVVEDLGFRGGAAQAGVALAVTSHIRVGIGIFPAAARNVAFAAMEVNTLAELFPGRVEVGVGHGVRAWMDQVHAWPGSPLTLLREQVAALRALLAGETVTVEGRYVNLTDVRLETPAAVPPPVLAGVRGPRSLAEAGRSTDGVVLAEPVTPEYLRAAREQMGAPLRVVGYQVACVRDDAAEARTLLRPGLEWIGEPEWAPHIAPTDVAEEFAAFRASCGTREEFARTMPDAWVDRFSVVGTPEQARARIGELHDAGADSIVLIPAGPPSEALAQLARVL